MQRTLQEHVRAAPDLQLIQTAQIPVGEGETIDGIGRGEVLVIQRREGYRFAVDALLVADFAGAPRGPVVDLGTGCGIVALMLAARGVRPIVAVEVQPALYQLAYRNISLNRRGEQVQLVHADLRRLRGVLTGGSVELVVSNPPYMPGSSGFVSPVSERAIARHDLSCSPADLADAARYLLRDGGALKLIYSASRLVELTGALAAASLETRRLRMVHPLPGRPAKRVLIEAVKGRRGPVEILPPLHLYAAAGRSTEEAQRILGELKPVPDVE